MLGQLARYLLSHWWTAFLLTLMVEVPLYVAMARDRVSPQRAALGGAAGSCITHPLLWFVWRQVVQHRLLYIVSGELIVVALESAVFFTIAKPIRFWQALGIACIANGVSYGTGLFLRALVELMQ